MGERDYEYSELKKERIQTMINMFIETLEKCVEMFSNKDGGFDASMVDTALMYLLKRQMTVIFSHCKDDLELKGEYINRCRVAFDHVLRSALEEAKQ